MTAGFDEADHEGEDYNPVAAGGGGDPADHMTEVGGVWFCTICQKGPFISDIHKIFRIFAPPHFALIYRAALKGTS